MPHVYGPNCTIQLQNLSNTVQYLHDGPTTDNKSKKKILSYYELGFENILNVQTSASYFVIIYVRA